MKIICIYHSADLDGWMSAAIVKYWFNQQEVPNKKDEPINTIEFLGYNYGDTIPDLSEYNKVIMCDVSFPKEEMEKIATSGIGVSSFIWIDHHISAIKDVNTTHFAKTANGLRNTKFAACELTWKYFFPNKTMPEIVRLLGRYDCFGHKNTDEEQKVLEFQYGARSYIGNYNEAFNYLISSLSDKKVVIVLHQAGIDIYQYLCTEAQQTYKSGFEIKLDERVTGFPNSVEFKTRKFICINKERFNPVNFGIDYHKDGYDGCTCFWYNGQTKLWHFSLYNDNGKVDCSIIAKQFGGGGHAGASGMVVDTETMLKINKPIF